MNTLSLDFETYSEIDLKACGAYVYARAASTEPLCCAYRFDETFEDNLDVHLWLPGDKCPAEISSHILSGGLIRAHNANFERLIMENVMPRYGWPVPKLEQFRCTMVEALAMGLPGALGSAAPALKLNANKDAAGSRIMLQLCKPRKAATAVSPAVRYTPESHPAKYQALYDYCVQDVLVEHAVAQRVLRLSDAEQQRWFADQRCNDRGLCVDSVLIMCASKIVEDAKVSASEAMREVTGNQVAGCSAVKQLTEWLLAGGIRTYSVDKESVAALLDRDDLTDAQRTALTLRQETAKSSTAKLESFLSRRNEDDRIRGTIQFHGANTGRDAARGVQVQNFPRPRPDTDIKLALEMIATADADMVESFCGSPISIVSDCLRSMIVAASGNKLFARDLSQIEARMLPWLAGAQAQLDGFRLFDRKLGPDTYVQAAAEIYGDDPHVLARQIAAKDKIASEKRQIGKVGRLALGYAGGASAFASMAKVYRVDIGKAYESIYDVSSSENQEKAAKAWQTRGRMSGMTERRYLAAEMVKLSFRDGNPELVRFWQDLENAAMDAMRQPGQSFKAGLHITYRKCGSFLRCRLPSGRFIWYPFPRIVSTKMPWKGRGGEDVYRDAIVYKGVNPITRQWDDKNFYGGLAAENVTQAAAADVMFEACARLEAAGYPPIMKVHDEVISETAAGFGSEAEFHTLFVQVPAWCPDLPIAADGWSGGRYRKG